MVTSPVVLAVDGNSLVHRSFHAQAHSAYRMADGQPAWAVRGLLAQLAAAADRAAADAIVVGFDDPTASVRRGRWPHYKAQRRPKLPGLEAQLELAVELTRALGVAVVVPPGLEADDVLASVAAYAPTVGGRTVLVTSDRDAFALVDEHTRLLRIINGGVEASPMLDPARAAMVLGVRPDQYRDLAALRGDPSDNLPGVRGVGPAKGSLLLGEFGSAAAAFDDAQAGGQRCRRILGAALTTTLADPASRRRWEENCTIMAMRDDIDLGLDRHLGAGDDAPEARTPGQHDQASAGGDAGTNR
ncbi:MAG: 5'-3' exonuclease H3TH domain-containing protein, partial [Micrococcales bacterium]|nr:5'-3' exonuclease H3TH domain-containing protein [Micrococcales bacterium]